MTSVAKLNTPVRPFIQFSHLTSESLYSSLMWHNLRKLELPRIPQDSIPPVSVGRSKRLHHHWKPVSWIATMLQFTHNWSFPRSGLHTPTQQGMNSTNWGLKDWSQKIAMITLILVSKYGRNMVKTCTQAKLLEVKQHPAIWSYGVTWNHLRWSPNHHKQLDPNRFAVARERTKLSSHCTGNNPGPRLSRIGPLINLAVSLTKNHPFKFSLYTLCYVCVSGSILPWNKMWQTWVTALLKSYNLSVSKKSQDNAKLKSI